MINYNHRDVGLQALLATTAPPSPRVAGESPIRLQGADWFLLAFTGVAGFFLGKHVERTR
jgi:hypothetical protein